MRGPFDWLAAAHLLLQSVIVLQTFHQTKMALNVICFRLGKDLAPLSLLHVPLRGRALFTWSDMINTG